MASSPDGGDYHGRRFPSCRRCRGPPLQHDPHAWVKIQSPLGLDGGTTWVMSFLEAPPGEFGCLVRGLAGGGEGTSGSRWFSRRWSGVASDASTTAGLGSMG